MDNYATLKKHNLIGRISDSRYISTCYKKKNMEWISIKDELPDKIGEYLAIIKRVDQEIGPYDAIEITWFDYPSELETELIPGAKKNKAEFLYGKVTHWMPLPELPKIKE